MKSVIIGARRRAPGLLRLPGLRWQRVLCALLMAGLLPLALGGCGSVRFVYANAERLTWWWLDGYVDFSRDETPRAKAAIDAYFAWHRSTQLLRYAALLRAAEAPVLAPTTAAEACRWQSEARALLQPALEHALQQAALLVPALGPAQWLHISERFDKSNAELRRDFLQPDAEERAQAAEKRVLERAEMLYGSLDKPQRAVIAAGVAASPFDPEAWLVQRQRRQQEAVATLRRLVAEHADHETILAALRALAERAEHSPDANYRRYRDELAAYNCGFVARLHNATTPAQRQAALEQLKSWDADLQTLAAKAAP